MSNILAVLSKAVVDKKKVAIREKDHSTIRVLEPYVVYMNREGSILADCYIHGSKGDDEVNQKVWTTVALSTINAAYMLNDHFRVQSSSDFNPKRDRYRVGLMAMIELVEAEGTISQVRKLWTHLGSALDGMLSDMPKRSK
ncbi:MAG: hypothetical protein BMS9Abin11_1781 [Gammaproteobacteria bacterium]|nr:MAG: hypothetical protein BMS9Abin11_1781 [Gammaproteobacteria bacterium]